MNALNSVEFIRNLTADKFWRKIEPDKVAQIAIEAAFRTDRTFQARDRKNSTCWRREWRSCVSDWSEHSKLLIAKSAEFRTDQNIPNSWSQESDLLEDSETAFRTDQAFQALDRKSQICWKREWRTCISDRSDISNSWSQESEPLEERGKKLNFGQMRTSQTLDRKNRICWKREWRSCISDTSERSKLLIAKIGPVGRERGTSCILGRLVIPSSWSQELDLLGGREWRSCISDRSDIPIGPVGRQTDRQRYRNARA